MSSRASGSVPNLPGPRPVKCVIMMLLQARQQVLVALLCALGPPLLEGQRLLTAASRASLEGVLWPLSHVDLTCVTLARSALELMALEQSSNQ